MAISEFRRVGFAGTKAPSITTLKRWIDEETIPGEKLGTMYFVWINQALELQEPPHPTLKAKMATANQKADRIAEKYLERRAG